MPLPIIYSETYKLHNPTFEIWPGGWIREYFESPQRVEIILTALRSTGWVEAHAPEAGWVYRRRGPDWLGDLVVMLTNCVSILVGVAVMDFLP